MESMLSIPALLFSFLAISDNVSCAIINHQGKEGLTVCLTFTRPICRPVQRSTAMNWHTNRPYEVGDKELQTDWLFESDR
jgi:hypothetical protein